jgi:two-component system, NarL family, response regulator LiaR
MLVDDHSFFRRGLRQMLTALGLDVVAEAGSAERALAIASRVAPNVVVMDLNMPGMDGTEATRRLAARAPGARMVVLSAVANDEAVMRAILAGARGYLVKDDPPEEIASGVRAVHGGRALLSQRVGGLVLERLRQREAERVREPLNVELSDREIGVLRMLAQGLENAKISAELNLSTSTVKTHVSNILGKLQLENRIQAAVYAAKKGLV